MGWRALQRRSGVLAATIALGALAGAAGAAPKSAWVGSWATSEQIPEPRNALAPEDLHDATLRQLVRLSLGGERIRVRVSNAFGAAPLKLASAHVARPVAAGSAAIEPATDRALTFDGRPDVIIPAGAEYLSDPIDFPVAPLSRLAISIRYDDAPDQQTSHPGSRTTSFLVHGDKVSAPDLPDAKKIDHWWQIAGVDVEAPQGAGAVVTLGDSITDGRGSDTNGDDRWPDILANRLAAGHVRVGVLNKGIGGNRVLNDGLGPNALARFDRDVLAPPGVRWFIVLEGVNDIGTLGNVPQAEHDRLVARVTGAFQQMIDRAHARGVKAIGATIMPYGGSNYASAPDADRQAINAWIRAPGHFDAVVDFDATARDPAHPEQLLPAYDTGDHLHLSPAGYRAIAEAIPLDLFAR
jgi:lysophospholipase L1-like esterase